MIARLRRQPPPSEVAPATDFDRQRARFRATWAPSRIAVLEGQLECTTWRMPFETRLLLAFGLGREGIGGPVKGAEAESTICTDCLERQPKPRGHG